MYIIQISFDFYKLFISFINLLQVKIKFFLKTSNKIISKRSLKNVDFKFDVVDPTKLFPRIQHTLELHEYRV